MIKIEVWVDVYPTEEIEKVELALSHIIGYNESNFIETRTQDDLTYQRVQRQATGIDSLEKLHLRIREQRIVQSCRIHFLKRMDEEANVLNFMINKQVLSVNRINICTSPAQSPMGPVHVKISSKDIEYLINYLAPPTQKGRVLEPGYLPEE